MLSAVSHRRKGYFAWKDVKLRDTRNFATTMTAISHEAHPITTPDGWRNPEKAATCQAELSAAVNLQSMCRDFSSKDQLTILRESSRLRSSSANIHLS